MKNINIKNFEYYINILVVLFIVPYRIIKIVKIMNYKFE